MGYITPNTIKGMLSERYKSFDFGYQKNSKQVCLFNNIEKINEFIKDFSVSLSYLTKEQMEEILLIFPKQNFYKSYEIISKIDKNFIERNGKKNKEFREAYNKWNKNILVKEKEPNSIKEVIELIKVWKKESGEKYGWIEHSGYDINFFENIFESSKENFHSLFFYYNHELVGYSIVEKSKTNFYNYVIRKTRKFNDLCLFIDFKTIESLFKEDQDIYINWGCSSGTLKKYKTKFPVFSQQKRFSCKIKKS